jgi:hypothetical protein
MRTLAIGVVLGAAATALVMAMSATSATARGANDGVFGGIWHATDVTDNSSMTFIVGEGGVAKSAILYDDYGTVCGSPVVVYGSVTLNTSRTTLTFNADGLCLQPGAGPFQGVTLHFTHNANGTLSDDSGDSPAGWSRSG